MKLYFWLLATGTSCTSISIACANSELIPATQNFKTTIVQAISEFESTQLSQWSFQISRYENEEGDETSSVERFNPQNVGATRWQLLQLNNRAPTASEQRDFQQRKQDSDSSISLRLSELIQVDSLVLVSEDNIHIRASFDVYLERLGADASEHLQGTLAFAKIDQAVLTQTIDVQMKGKFTL